MSHRDGVPEVVWALACWRHNLKYYSVKMGGDLHSTPEAAELACARCAIEGHDGKCMEGLKNREPIRLWPPPNQKGGA